MRGKPKAEKKVTTFNKKRSYLKQPKTTAAQREAIENEFSDKPLSRAEFKRKIVNSKRAA
jgi:hypothetical protein